MLMTKEDAVRETYNATPADHCVVCRQTTRGARQVTPCANIKCKHSICNECQGTDTIAAQLGTCDDPDCAVEALRDLRAMFAAKLRRAA